MDKFRLLEDLPVSEDDVPCLLKKSNSYLRMKEELDFTRNESQGILGKRENPLEFKNKNIPDLYLNSFGVGMPNFMPTLMNNQISTGSMAMGGNSEHIQGHPNNIANQLNNPNNQPVTINTRCEPNTSFRAFPTLKPKAPQQEIQSKDATPGESSPLISGKTKPNQNQQGTSNTSNDTNNKDGGLHPRLHNIIKEGNHRLADSNTPIFGRKKDGFKPVDSAAGG